LDLKTLFGKVLKPSQVITCIKYFTALVSSTLQDPDKALRQKTYLRALRAHIQAAQDSCEFRKTHPEKRSRHIPASISNSWNFNPQARRLVASAGLRLPTVNKRLLSGHP
jgi:gamma-glutamyl:cysteine ligase YbdK (ATP-grasp superfamily)